VSESSCQSEVPQGQMTIARSFNCGSAVAFGLSPTGTVENRKIAFRSSFRDLIGFGSLIPQLKLRAIFGRADGAAN